MMDDDQANKKPNNPFSKVASGTLCELLACGL